MKTRKRMENGGPAASEGARRATDDAAGAAPRRMVEENDAQNRPRNDDREAGGTPGTPQAAATGPLAPGQRWSAARKREVVLRLLRGESLDALSRELGVESYRLEEWKQRAFAGIDASLRERETTPERVELDAALKRLGELTMDYELLQERCRRSGVSPLVPRRSGK